MNTKEKKQVPLELINQFYRIEENGNIFSFRKQKYLKTTLNTVGYEYVMLTYDGINQIWAIHRLVAAKYIGQCPYNNETSHRDGNKLNNHYTNLEYISHSANILKSFNEHGRSRYNHGNVAKGFIHTLETKRKMATAKHKPVRLVFDGMEAVFPSIGDAAKSLDINRKTIYNCIHLNKPLFTKDNLISGTLSFV